MRKRATAAGLVALLSLGCGLGEAADKTEAEKNAGTVAVTDAATEPAASSKPAESSKPAKPADTIPTIEDGTWTVGSDVPAGTYRVVEKIGADSLCYWSITKTGSNGENIIKNDLGAKGLPRVTLKKGQDFETSDCGVWQKIK
ncbi:hypothetical protein GCM10029963_28580 [Micromonospora andamanensis]|uniref:hypothetical protein n=1 Tax=Micromonospora andamanensis TaxID=1287068 RepID=UPI001951F510|nr:hypothetical protein [Micromonospora andamanensis]GIJ38508.1 hypothetical protein Vwe01_18330 [Micromonospora andamanensis]